MRAEKNKLNSLKNLFNLSSIGQVKFGIAFVSGLTQVKVGELVHFCKQLFGMALNLEHDRIGVVIFGDDKNVKQGQNVDLAASLSFVLASETINGYIPSESPFLRILNKNFDVRHTSEIGAQKNRESPFLRILNKKFGVTQPSDRGDVASQIIDVLHRMACARIRNQRDNIFAEILITLDRMAQKNRESPFLRVLNQNRLVHPYDVRDTYSEIVKVMNRMAMARQKPYDLAAAFIAILDSR
jgi:ATP synthase alpha/beta family, beta-barrel domain